MATKEEIMKLAGEPVGYMYEYSYDLNGDKQGNWPVEMHTHVAFSRSKPSGVDSKPLYTSDQVLAARKPLEEQYASMTKSFFDAQAQLREALALESKWRVEATGLRQQLAAANAEIERLNTESIGWRNTNAHQHAAEIELRSENRELRQQLAAAQALAKYWSQKHDEAQAREQQLREAFELQRRDKWHWEDIRDKALALPTDTSALEAIVEKAGEVMREQAATELVDLYNRTSTRNINDFVEAIRALPGVTLADMKGAE